MSVRDIDVLRSFGYLCAHAWNLGSACDNSHWCPISSMSRHIQEKMKNNPSLYTTLCLPCNNGLFRNVDIRDIYWSSYEDWCDLFGVIFSISHWSELLLAF